MVAEVLSGGVGEHHLRLLAEALAKALKAPLVMIGQVAGPTGETVQTVALVRDGKIVENIRYTLQGTPCEKVSTGMCVYKSKVASLFSAGLRSKRHGRQSYVGGIAAGGFAGARAGAAGGGVFKAPAGRSTHHDALRIFGARAALELEQIVMDDRLFRQLTAGL